MTGKINFALIRQKNPEVADTDEIASITSIDLSNCGITEVDNLDLFTHILELNLSSNAIQTVSNLELFSKLVHLDLSNNCIDSEGLLSSVPGIPPNLQSINLTGNPCTSNVDALGAFQDKFADLGIIIDVEDAAEEGEEAVVGAEAGAPPSSSATAAGNQSQLLPSRPPTAPSGTKPQLDAANVLKDIVDRKCRLQNLHETFDLEGTIQTLNKELEDALSSSDSHRVAKHDLGKEIVSAQDCGQDQHSTDLRRQLERMLSQSREESTSLKATIARIRATAEQALGKLGNADANLSVSALAPS